MITHSRHLDFYRELKKQGKMAWKIKVDHVILFV